MNPCIPLPAAPPAPTPPAPPRRPAPGVGLTLWTGGDLATVLTPETRELLAETRPDIVCIHAGPDRLLGAAARIARSVRALVPGVRLQLGLGWDLWMARAIAGNVTLARAVQELADAGDLADALGCEALIHDAEGACKRNSHATALVARDVLAAVRAEHPHVIQGHTAYDHPTLHSDDRDGDYDDGKVVDEYAWRAFLRDPDAGVDWEVPQNYVAPQQVEGAPPRFASPGALRRRIASSDASFRRAEALGWIRPGVPRDRYFQAHHVPFAQTTTAGADVDVALLWCGPHLPRGRMDASGAWALRGLCAMQRAGIRRPGGIGAFQRARGLRVDVPHPIAGRQVLAQLGVHVPAGVR